MVQTCDSEGNFMAWPKMGSFNSKVELSHHFLWCVCVCGCIYELWPTCAGLTFLYFKDIFYHPGSLLFINPNLYQLIHALLLASSQTCIFNWMLPHRGKLFWGTKFLSKRHDELLNWLAGLLLFRAWHGILSQNCTARCVSYITVGVNALLSLH